MAITDLKVSEAYAGRDIASLSDRPNQDGLTAAQLKARFDQLGKEVIPKYNDLIDLLDDYIQSNNTNIIALEDAIDGLGIALGDLGLSVQEVLDAYTSGALQGKSAYQIAVEEGFIGTESEWLLSLKGSKGDGFVILGHYDTLLELETAFPIGQKGDAWSIGTVEPYDVYVWNDTLNDWDNIGQISPSNDASGITYNGIIDGYLVNNVEEALDTIDTSLAGKANSTHTHITSDVTGLDTALSGKAPISHTHTIADTISLQGTLDSKQPNLISGTNIKTINGNSLLGSGDIPTMLPKNWIINGMFDVWQRATSQTTSGYGSDDRWVNQHNGSTKTHSQQSFTIGQTVVPNNPKYYSRTVVSSVAGVVNYVFKEQRIEDVTKLAGKVVTLSFWAKADANKNLSIELLQNFGVGGSANVEAIGVQKFALTNLWQRFTKTITIPSVSGKTIGANNFLSITIYFDAGSNFNARTDSLGNQSGTFDIANVSLVEGSVAVECQNQPYADVLRECQRYCFRLEHLSANFSTLFAGLSVSINAVYFGLILPQEMRSIPIIESYYGIKFTSATTAYATTTINLVVNSSSKQAVNFNVNTASTITSDRIYLFQLAQNGYLLLSAEL